MEQLVAIEEPRVGIVVRDGQGLFVLLESRRAGGTELGLDEESVDLRHGGAMVLEQRQETRRIRRLGPERQPATDVAEAPPRQHERGIELEGLEVVPLGGEPGITGERILAEQKLVQRLRPDAGPQVLRCARACRVGKTPGA